MSSERSRKRKCRKIALSLEEDIIKEAKQCINETKTIPVVIDEPTENNQEDFDFEGNFQRLITIYVYSVYF